MDTFVTEDKDKIHILRLDQGDYVLESIFRMIKEKDIRQGIVLSGIGTLDRCVIHMVTTTGYPPKEHFTSWEDQPLELLSIQGIIANGTPHLHMVISDREKAYGGHLEEGCRILYLGEVAILELDDNHMMRVPNDKGIMMLLSELPSNNRFNTSFLQ